MSAARKVTAAALVRRIDRMLRRLGEKERVPASKNIGLDALELWARDLGVLRCDENVAEMEEAGA